MARPGTEWNAESWLGCSTPVNMRSIGGAKKSAGSPMAMSPATGGSVTQSLAIWGAILSTLLACLRIWEFWQGRFRIEVSTLFTGCKESGHRVSVRNLSGKQLILEHWAIMRVSGRWPRRTANTLVSAEFDANDIVIASQSTFPLSFVEESYFPWGGSLGGDRLAIRLHFAGRRSVLRYLTP